MDQKAKYVKTNWVDKETIITANNMNKLENQVDILTDSLELANASLAEKVQGAEGKKIKILSGVIRNEGQGWYYIINETHEKLNMSGITTNADNIKLDFGFNAKKVIGFVCSPDETYQSYGIQCGASVGTNWAEIKFSRITREIKAYITKTGNVFNFEPTFSKNINNLVWDETDKKLTINHAECWNQHFGIENRSFIHNVLPASGLLTNSASVYFQGNGGYINSYIYFNGTNWVSTETDVNYNRISSVVFNSVDGYLTINHEKCLSFAMSAQTKDTSYQCSVVSSTNNSTVLKFHDATGNIIKVADTNMKVMFTRHKNNPREKLTPDDGDVSFYFYRPSILVENINPNTLSHAGGNIWFMGVFEVD